MKETWSGGKKKKKKGGTRVRQTKEKMGKGKQKRGNLE